MQGPSDHFLSGATFARNQDGMSGAPCFDDHAVELFHLGRAPDHAAESSRRFVLLELKAALGLGLEVVADVL